MNFNTTRPDLKKILLGFYREYPRGLLASYLAMAAGIIAQIVLVPNYLANLGAAGFGGLVLILALINYSVIGVGWLSGGLQRILGETFATNNSAEFVAACRLGKIIFVSYAFILLIVGVIILATMWRVQFSIWLVIVAGLFILANYEMMIERIALAAAARLAASNILQFIQTIVYAVSVFFALQAGGKLIAVFSCQLGSVLFVRMLLPIFWQGTWPRIKSDARIRPLFARLTGRMGGGYFLAGALILTGQSDVLILGWLGGAEAAAQYTLVWKIAEVCITALWRIPESWTPILVRLDAAGDSARIARQYRHLAALLLITSMFAGVTYAFLGQKIVTFWLGPEHAPKEQLGFMLAGAAVVWVALARLPSILAYGLARLKLYNGVVFAEVVARVILTLSLYPHFGYLAPLVALNVVHVLGIAGAYQWVGWRLRHT